MCHSNLYHHFLALSLQHACCCKALTHTCADYERLLLSCCHSSTGVYSQRSYHIPVPGCCQPLAAAALLAACPQPPPGCGSCWSCSRLRAVWVCKDPPTTAHRNPVWSLFAGRGAEVCGRCLSLALPGWLWACGGARLPAARPAWPFSPPAAERARAGGSKW